MASDWREVTPSMTGDWAKPKELPELELTVPGPRELFRAQYHVDRDADGETFIGVEVSYTQGRRSAVESTLAELVKKALAEADREV